MTLNDFINKRLVELKMNRSDLVNKFDINWSTLSCITQGKNVGTITKEKLARGLQCTIGDINSILAQQPHPLRKEVKAKSQKEAVMETVDKLEQIVKEEHPNMAQPEEVPFTDSDPEDEAPEVDMMFPVETEVETDNRITREVAEECYKRKLKDKVGKILASTHHELTDAVRQEIGAMLLQELWGESE